MAYISGLIDWRQLDPAMRQDLEDILRRVPSYLDIILEECVKLIAELRIRHTYKRLTC